jgi:hypothetical protein
MVKLLTDADQHMAEVLENAVIAPLVGISKSCPGDRRAESDMVEFVPMGIQACFNVPEALPSRQLGICQTKELIEGGKSFDPVLSSVPANTKLEIVPGEKLKQLPENGFTEIHRYPPKIPGRVSSAEIQIENEKLCQRTM